MTPHVCFFCGGTFAMNHEDVHELIVEDDGDAMMLAPVCPECWIEEAEEIARVTADHDAWLKRQETRH